MQRTDLVILACVLLVMALVYPNGLPVVLFPRFLLTPITDNLNADQAEAATRYNARLVAGLEFAYSIRPVVDKYHKYLGLPCGMDALNECDANVFSWPLEKQALYADAICRALARDPAMKDRIMQQLDRLDYAGGLTGPVCVSVGNLAYLSKASVDKEVRHRASEQLIRLSAPEQEDEALRFIN